MDHYQAIKQLMYRYAAAIDAGDFEGVASLFREGAIGSSVAEGESRGYDEVLALYRHSTRLYDNGTPCTQHLNSNIIIELNDNGMTASAHSRFTVYQSLPDFPLQAIIAGDYFDQFTLNDGQWQFSFRRMEPKLFGDLSRHLLMDLPS